MHFNVYVEKLAETSEQKSVRTKREEIRKKDNLNGCK